MYGEICYNEDKQRVTKKVGSLLKPHYDLDKPYLFMVKVVGKMSKVHRQTT